MKMNVPMPHKPVTRTLILVPAPGCFQGPAGSYPSHSMQYEWPSFSRASWDRCRTRKQE